jgi:hypothetical protein
MINSHAVLYQTAVQTACSQVYYQSYYLFVPRALDAGFYRVIRGDAISGSHEVPDVMNWKDWSSCMLLPHEEIGDGNRCGAQLLLTSKAHRYGMKKESKGSKTVKESRNTKDSKNWAKIGFVAFGVFFAAAMILTYMSPMIGAFKTVKANETVIVDYTLRDSNGDPVVTSNQQLFSTAGKQGLPVFFTQPILIRAGEIGNDPLISVPAYNAATGWEIPYALLGLEIDEISQGIVGTRVGDTKTITFSFADDLQVNMTPEEFNGVGGNFTAAKIGDPVPLVFMISPTIASEDSNQTQPDNSSIRLAKVIVKDNSSIIVSHRYATADVSVQKYGS